MPIKKEIPNKALEGHELKQYAFHVFDAAARERLGGLADAAIKEFHVYLDNDCFFRSGTAYPGVSFQIAVKVDIDRLVFAPVFHFPNMPTYPNHEPYIRPVDLSTATSADNFKQLPRDFAPYGIKCKVDNPNLVRIKLGMPIYETHAMPPGAGEVFGRIQRDLVPYNAADYPEIPAPIIWRLGEPIPNAPPQPISHKVYSPAEMRSLDLNAPPLADDMMSSSRISPPPDNLQVEAGAGEAFQGIPMRLQQEEVIQDEDAASTEPAGEKASDTTEGGAGTAIAVHAAEDGQTAPPDINPAQQSKRGRRK